MRESSQSPEWPFTIVSRKRSPAGSKTIGADVMVWQGPLNGKRITFTTRPRNCDPHASFHVSSNARIHYTTMHAQYVDLHVHGVLAERDRELLGRLAQSWDTRPVVVRCDKESVRSTPASTAVAMKPQKVAESSEPSLFDNSDAPHSS